MRIILLLIACIASGCMSAPKTCISERTIGTIIRWGNGDMQNGSYKGYEMHAKELAIFAIERDNAQSGMNPKRLDSIDVPLFCGRLQEIVGAFTAIQSLYSPGKTYRSVEYINTKTNVHMKAIWNPEFATFGSKEFRAIYDSLMLAVPLMNSSVHEKN